MALALGLLRRFDPHAASPDPSSPAGSLLLPRPDPEPLHDRALPRLPLPRAEPDGHLDHQGDLPGPGLRERFRSGSERVDGGRHRRGSRRLRGPDRAAMSRLQGLRVRAPARILRAPPREPGAERPRERPNVSGGPRRKGRDPLPLHPAGARRTFAHPRRTGGGRDRPGPGDPPRPGLRTRRHPAVRLPEDRLRRRGVRHPVRGNRGFAPKRPANRHGVPRGGHRVWPRRPRAIPRGSWIPGSDAAEPGAPGDRVSLRLAGGAVRRAAPPATLQGT